MRSSSRDPSGGDEGKSKGLGHGVEGGFVHPIFPQEEQACRYGVVCLRLRKLILSGVRRRARRGGSIVLATKPLVYAFNFCAALKRLLRNSRSELTGLRSTPSP